MLSQRRSNDLILYDFLNLLNICDNLLATINIIFFMHFVFGTCFSFDIFSVLQ